MKTGKGTEVTVGCDPEFFLMLDGTPVSAHDIVPGSKQQPYKIPCGAVQCDGTAVEFNINPASTPEEFVSNIDTVLGHLRKKIPKKYEFAFVPEVTYSTKYWDSLPEECKQIGCDPDYNYGVIRKPVNLHPTCIAGGHIHIGYSWANYFDKNHLNHCNSITNILNHKVDYARWQKHGARHNSVTMNVYRPKTYGVEIRGFSNEWLNHREIWPEIFGAAIESVSVLERNLGSCPEIVAPTKFFNNYKAK